MTITEYISSLPRQERSYAACYAHHAEVSGPYAATLASADSAKGISRQAKRIRATIDAMIASEACQKCKLAHHWHIDEDAETFSCDTAIDYAVNAAEVAAEGGR